MPLLAILIVLFLLYLSLVRVGQLFFNFQWEYLLLEAGFLSIFLASGVGPNRLLVFLLPLQRNARALLTRAVLNDDYQTGRPRMKLTAKQMLSLYDFFKAIDDSRRAQGKKHQLATVLSLAAAAVLCGMRGYKDISLWVKSLSNHARSRFKCRKRNGRYEVPCRTVIRNVLIRVGPEQLDRALNAWNAQYGSLDESLAIDGKTMCNAVDAEQRQTHILGVVGQVEQCFGTTGPGSGPPAAAYASCCSS